MLGSTSGQEPPTLSCECGHRLPMVAMSQLGIQQKCQLVVHVLSSYNDPNVDQADQNLRHPILSQATPCPSPITTWWDSMCSRKNICFLPIDCQATTFVFSCFLNKVTIPQPLPRLLRYSCQATRTVSNQFAASKKKLRPCVNNMAWATSKKITVSK